MQHRIIPLIALLIPAAPSLAFDVNEQLAINGLLSASGQCQDVSAVLPAGDFDEIGTLDSFDSICRGGMPFQPEIVYSPTDADEFFLKLGFAVGNGLNGVSPFALAPWAADMEGDVKNINGRDRDYLLEAWYSHTFRWNDANELEVTGGIIDPAFYVNENAYASDEYTQFMNEAFVNSHSAFLPAYDAGLAVVWKVDRFTFSGVGMNVGENDDGYNYNWYGAEVDYRLETPIGEGHYRLLYSGTSSAFLAPGGEDKKRLSGWILSFDQELGDVFGAFVRMGWQSDDAAITYDAGYSAGIDIRGNAWGRAEDNIGIGFAYLDGGNGDVRRTHAFESYYRFVLNEYFALTADVQYMQDARTDSDDIDGWVFGLRAAAEF